ncbi:MAG: lysozyme inhibitor LprI family protein [Bacteroidota bacterium]
MQKIILIVLSMIFFSCQNQEKIKTVIKYVKVKEKTEQTSNQIDTIKSKFDCYDGSQLEMNMCSANELTYYDSILNVKYKIIIQKLDKQIIEEVNLQENSSENLKKIIIESQKIWIKSKESNRNVIQFQYNGGSMLPFAKNSQTIIDTKERIKFLEELLLE